MIGYSLGLLALLLNFFVLPINKKCHDKTGITLIMAVIAIVLITKGI